MEILQKRINQTMKVKNWRRVDLSDVSKEGSSKISMIVNGSTKDTRMSSLIKIEDVLDVSLDYLVGRSDNPLGMCYEELGDPHIDTAARELLCGFEFLSPDGKEAIQDQVNFRLSKSKAKDAERLEDSKAVGVA